MVVGFLEGRPFNREMTVKLSEKPVQIGSWSQPLHGALVGPQANIAKLRSSSGSGPAPSLKHNAGHMVPSVYSAEQPRPLVYGAEQVAPLEHNARQVARPLPLEDGTRQVVPDPLEYSAGQVEEIEMLTHTMRQVSKMLQAPQYT
ncbi:unnamed protein product [Clonostachys byssicola]|uniref:Uncharacterized protein n=1 Tax=Clonostachys byssicola TaxID=160290 RepID=A0A9N9YAF2_9HYPO|nr:unnamed protein product [Clonostachys byssicola]